MGTQSNAMNPLEAKLAEWEHDAKHGRDPFMFSEYDRRILSLIRMVRKARMFMRPEEVETFDAELMGEMETAK